MTRKLMNRDSLALSGSVLGIASIWFGWLTLRPSRVATGYSYHLWEVSDWNIATVILGLWLICFVLSLQGKKRSSVIFLGVTANLILIVTFMLVGLYATQLLKGEEPFSRISLGAGVWTSLLAAYILIFAARHRLIEIPVCRHLISFTGVAAIIALFVIGWLNNLSVIQEFIGRESRFQQELLQHIFLFVGSVTAGTLLGIPLGIWATRSLRVEKPIFYFANITQTIPSLALFGLLIAPLSALSFAFPFLRDIGIRGVGPTPAIIALIIYSLLPIVRNTFVGFRQIDSAVIDAGLGMGMSRTQIFRKIEVPLAAPLVVEGVRIASVQSVGLVTVAALIGAGGLGWFVFYGLGQAAPDLIILGAIPIIILAFIVDAVMRTLVRIATPKGLARGTL